MWAKHEYGRKPVKTPARMSGHQSSARVALQQSPILCTGQCIKNVQFYKIK